MIKICFRILKKTDIFKKIGIILATEDNQIAYVMWKQLIQLYEENPKPVAGGLK